MREVLKDIEAWLANGEAVALATVVQTWGSAPRREGAKMALSVNGGISGSVSGGCVEGAVVEAGVASLRDNKPALLSFGVADETAWEVGLACGGRIRVFVEPLDPELYDLLQELVQRDKSARVATVIAGEGSWIGAKLVHAHGELLYCRFPETTSAESVQTIINATSTISQPRSVNLTLADQGLELFVDTIRPAPKLILVGGVHIAIALASMAKTLGFRTIVIDPRRAFGSVDRFPHVDKLIQAWPDKAFSDLLLDESTAVVMLTHDPKIDDPALLLALPAPTFYVGALGSTSTHTRRVARLLKAGLSSEHVGRIHAPVGLDIGAQTPEEIAVAVLAEIVAAQHGEA